MEHRAIVLGFFFRQWPSLLLILLACLAARPAYAACSNPTGTERDIIYNGDYHAYQFCNGTNWIATGYPFYSLPTNGLIGYWKLDEGSGTLTVDSSGNGNTGTINGTPTWTTGKNGAALLFSDAGGSYYLDMGNITAMNGLTAITVSAWVKSSSVGANAGEHHFTDKSACDGGSGPFELGVNMTGGTNNAEFVVYPAGGGFYATGQEFHERRRCGLASGGRHV